MRKMLPAERGFLAALDADPADRTTRLVYADWLDERGDLRGEWLRVEEELHDLPAHTDRWWERKMRRDELRQKCDPRWLRRMCRHNDYAPTFREVPAGWRERWRLIRAFTERWHGIPMGDVGGQREAIERVERKHVGFSLPPSVREWIAFSVDLSLQGQGHLLRHCFSVQYLPELEAVSLMLEANPDRYRAVRRGDLDDPDPRVRTYHWGPPGQEHWVHEGVTNPHVTHLELENLLAYNFGRGGGFRTWIDPTSDLPGRLHDAFAVHATFDDLHLFESPNVIAWLKRDFLCVEVGERGRPETLPELLRAFPLRRIFPWSRGCHHHGMFVSDGEQLRAVWPPPWPDDDIPF